MPPRRNEASSAKFSLEEWRGHLGRKVSLRYKLRDDPKYPFTELVGVVQSVGHEDDGRVTIIDRNGRSHQVKVDDVVGAKLFPGAER
ncbi:MAG TPA: hypothetical protein VNC78_10780 [Actinomycetota bacterium]|nr:hypothetical protein [Actinomycetota bacterium]